MNLIYLIEKKKGKKHNEQDLQVGRAAEISFLAKQANNVKEDPEL